MTRYLEFATGDGESVLVEVDDDEIVPPPGIEKAGLVSKRVGDTVATAAATFEEAIARAVRRNVEALDAAVLALPNAPTELELTFALKATGEVGNLAIAKVGGEANFTVRLAWKLDSASGRRS
jgi:glutamate mutase epsilon subunit